jgi:uncharacterized protein YuzE
MTMTRDELESLCIDGFFKMMNARNLDGAMANMADDCEMRIPSSSFTYTGKAALRIHLADFLVNFKAVNFHDFVPAVDPVARRAGIYFTVSMTDNDGEETHMGNCNFFEVNEEGKIYDILIFAAKPLSKGFEVGNSPT